MTLRERDEFVAAMGYEGLPVDHIRSLLSWSRRLHRIAELLCSSEAADRDRVPCPGTRFEADCICDGTDGQHESVPRAEVQQGIIRGKIESLCRKYEIRPVFSGDPRGAVVKLQVPSGRTNDWGGVGVCVPS